MEYVKSHKIQTKQTRVEYFTLTNLAFVILYLCYRIPTSLTSPVSGFNGLTDYSEIGFVKVDFTTEEMHSFRREARVLEGNSDTVEVKVLLKDCLFLEV